VLLPTETNREWGTFVPRELGARVPIRAAGTLSVHPTGCNYAKRRCAVVQCQRVLIKNPWNGFKPMLVCMGMIRIPPNEILTLVGAFQTAWLSLLHDERVLANNVDRLPGLLMGAVLDAAAEGESDEEKLAAAALSRLSAYERELENSESTNLQ
jgi:hypothetical protein